MGSVVDNPPSFDGTLGCLLIGGIFWGASNIQLYSYYSKYSNTDRWWLKLHVFSLYAVDTVHQAFLLASLYSYFITNFSRFENLFSFERPLLDTTLISAFISILAQSLFVMRIWQLSDKNHVLTATLAIFVAGQFVATAVYYGKTFNNPEAVQIGVANASELAMNCTVAIVDISLAAVLAYLLRSLRSGVKRTNFLITRLILYIISTGLATSVFALLALITFITRPTSLVYWVFNLTIPKLYMNSSLALLNSRQGLRDQLADGVCASTPTSCYTVQL
ncbi:hypothetical protein M0805_000529 [Coniferiporia weirii]|nr:hypothetical protein M0805_000529 [Coniferiporia weirii]